MRVVVTAIVVAALLQITNSPALAAPVQWVSFEFLNSRLTFGLNPTYHAFRDIGVCAGSSGDDYTCWTADDGDSMEALSGPLVSQTLHVANGQVYFSDYLYAGGTVTLDVNLDDGARGRFVAKIKTLEIGAPNSTGDGFDSTYPYYTLGRGRFDAAFAKTLGVGRTTLGGSIDTNMVLVPDDEGDGGNYLSERREAWDGGSYMDLVVTPVPEASTLVLAATALVAALRRARKRDDVVQPLE